MKKIIILLIFTLFSLTGCYDNIELNDLDIISGVGIDYKENEYYVTYEILSNTKTLENTTLKSYTVSGSGKSISDAFISASYKTGNKAYFAHLKLVVLGNELLNGHLTGITDYLLRDINIRDEFKVVVANNTTPEEILKHNTESIPVVSEFIIKLLKNEKYNNNLVIDQNFEDIVKKSISENYDIILNTISIKGDDITIDDSFILKNNKYKNTINKNYSSLYNMLTTNTLSIEFDKKYDDKVFSINVNNSKTKIEVQNDKIKISTTLVAEVLENNPKFNLKIANTYTKLNKDFEELIKKNIKEFIEFLQREESDILGFQEIYYKNTRKNNKGLWKTSDIDISVDLTINTKGLIFEVN